MIVIISKMFCLRKKGATLTVGLFGILFSSLVITRAVYQDITIDEARSYQLFVDPSSNLHWHADAANHILNSLFQRVTTALFGVSEFTLRLPAVLASLAYMVFAGRLAGLLFEYSWFSVLFFGLLLFNPFLLDYLVAARGYSLALAFQLGALLFVAEDIISSRRQLYLVSVLCGLCLCANFAFAVTATAIIAGYFFWIHPPFLLPHGQWRPAVFTALKLGLPFALIIVIIAGQLILNMSKEQLYFGTYSPIKSLNSVMQAVFPWPDGLILSAEFSPTIIKLNWYAWWSVPVLLALFPFLFIHPILRRDLFARFCLVVLILTCSGHLGMMLLDNVRLPLSRTASFLVVPVTIIIAAVAARLKFVGLAALSLLTISFFAAIRISYFAEWRFNAGIRQAVIVAAHYAKSKNISVIGSTFATNYPANFYRQQIGYDFEPLQSAHDPDLRVDIHIVGQNVGSTYGDILRAAGFEVVYENTVSKLRVFVRPSRSVF